MSFLPLIRRALLVSLVAVILALSAVAQEKVIPSIQCRGLFIVPVTWNGESLDLILDTGAPNTSIDPDALERAIGKRARTGKKVTLRKGHAGPLKLNKIKARVHELDHIALALGHRVDGILGVNVFNELLLTLDYPAAEVRVSNGSLPAPDNNDIYLDIGKSRPFIALDVAGERLAVLIDSGFAGGVDLELDDELKWGVEPRPVFAAVRYSEIVLQHAGRLAHDIEIGPLTLERPVVRVSDGTRLIGAQVLSRLAVTFDRANRRIRMTPDTSEPLRLDSLRSWGFAFRPRIAGMEVIEVFPDTEASSSGIRKGDILLEVDGMPVHERGCASLHPQGESALSTLKFLRDDQPFVLELPTVVLVP